jgi:hypothetical protein
VTAAATARAALRDLLAADAALSAADDDDVLLAALADRDRRFEVARSALAAVDLAALPRPQLEELQGLLEAAAAATRSIEQRVVGRRDALAVALGGGPDAALRPAVHGPYAARRGRGAQLDIRR